MKVKVYDLEKYVKTLTHNNKPVDYNKIAIIKCRKGIVMLNEESIGNTLMMVWNIN